MEFNRRRFLQAGGTAALMGTAGHSLTCCSKILVSECPNSPSRWA